MTTDAKDFDIGDFIVPRAPVPTATDQRATLRSVRKLLRARGVRKEIRETLRLQTTDHLENPWYGKGRFVSHLVIGMVKPITLCRKLAIEVSSVPFVTPIGRTCSRCLRIWSSAVRDRNAEAEHDVLIAEGKVATK